MYKSVLIVFSVAMIICLFQSCIGPASSGLHTVPMAPRLIQPVQKRGNKNTLPPKDNFVQAYTKYKKSKANSQFGALVRIIEFEYDISDSISITPRLTSGYDEGEMTGLFTIILDQYELTYENKKPEVREYVEKVSFESSKNFTEKQILYSNPLSAGVGNNRLAKQDKVINRSQLYNSAKFLLEPEDARFIQRSKTLYYVINLQNCEISVYPSKEQIRVLKKMILKHYSEL